MGITVFSHPIFEQHYNGPGHPECPERLIAIHEMLHTSSLPLKFIKAKPTTREVLYQTHPQDYIDTLFGKSPKQDREGRMMLDGDTSLSTHTMEAVMHAVGCLLQSAEVVKMPAIQRAFCAVRPPGHHAEVRTPMGFCVVNHIAVLAHHLSSDYERVAIVDFDVHHGNGTEAIVRGHPNIRFYSTYQQGIFPGNTRDGVHENIHNIPLTAHTDGEAYRAIFEREVLADLEKYQPQIVLVSAGFDAHQRDPLASLVLTEQDFYNIGKALAHVADTYAEGKLIATLEGGYNLEALAASVLAFLEGIHT